MTRPRLAGFVCVLVVLFWFFNLGAPAQNQAAVDQAAPAGAADAAPVASTSDQVKALLIAAFDRSTFAYLPGPYHFVASFQTFAPDGSPAGEGSIEKYFASPGHVKVITRFGGHTMTAYYNGSPWLYTDSRTARVMWAA